MLQIGRVEIGFFFWPYDVALVRAMAEAADRFGYDLVGIADTPGNAMDPWVAATLVAVHTRRARVAVRDQSRDAPPRRVGGGDRVRGPARSGSRRARHRRRSQRYQEPGRVEPAAGELAEGVTFIKELLRGRPASYRGGSAHLPWVKQPSPVFLAASHPRSLRAAGATADGAFINYGLSAENVRESEATVIQAATAAGRNPADVEIWQIACLDCHEDGAASRRKIGAILAFVSAYVMGGGDLARRGVPPQYHEPLRELRRRYSTRPGDADAALVAELGLFDYLSRRLAVCGTPEECLAQVRAARAAGARRPAPPAVSLVDPVRTVQLFGEKVLPVVRTEG